MEKTSSNARRVVRGVFLLVLLASLGPAGVRADEKAAGAARNGRVVPVDAAAFALKEISAFDVPESIQSHFASGQYVECRTEPNEQVKLYPHFTSAHPLHGALVLGTQAGRHRAGPCYQFALDESAGTGRGYDRLYFDTNRNGDLTDDGSRTPRADVAQKARLGPSSSTGDVWFDLLAVGLDANDGPERRLELWPHLLIYDGDGASRAYVFFVGAKVHQGVIRIGEQKFTAVLGHNRNIDGRFDQPETALHLLPADDPARGRPIWRGGMQLSSMHRCGNIFYRFAATPAGDKLFVWPYQGSLGTLEIGAGGRNVGDMSIAGSLNSHDASISLSAELTVQLGKPVRSCRLPVGDYGADLLSVAYGQLHLLVLRNMHADGRPRGRPAGRNEVYPIKIRADRPCVLDFSSKPQVLFASPARDLRLRPGEELNIKAVLIDPALDIMFRSIRKGSELNPKVVIKRANGSILAEGVMPFG
jgi:hypothetical protein